MKIRSAIPLSLTILAALSLALDAQARIWRILPDGSGDAPTIQEGIERSVHYDTVLVAPGVYSEAIDFLGKKIAVGSYFLTAQDTSYISQTVLDGYEHDVSTVSFHSAEEYSARLIGLTIIRGRGTWNGWQFGGGIFCNSTSPTLSHLIIRDCFYIGVEQFGGGIACLSDASPLIEHVLLEGNRATYGGGIYCEGPGADPLIRDSIIRGNISRYGCGVSAYYGADPVLVNVILAGNTGLHADGCIFGEFSDHITLVNVTITGNDNQAVFLSNNSQATIVNSILWNNAGPEIEFLNAYTPCAVVLSHSDVTGGMAGVVTNDNGTIDWLEGMIDEDPLFLLPEEGDYRLRPESPCIDAGTAYFEWNGEVIVDLEVEEYSGLAPDMGALEFTPELAGAGEVISVLATRLLSNDPNPFNPITSIRYVLPGAGSVRLSVYDLGGRLVRNLVQQAMPGGAHSATWDGEDDGGNPVASGTYFCRLQSGSQAHTRPMMLIR